MHIVIDIPEKIYEQLKFLNKQGFGTVIDEAVANGTPLPKGHGRLIDADVLLDQISRDKKEAFTKHQVWLLLSQYNNNAPTIIEANKESEKYVEERLRNYNNLLKSGILDCVMEKSQESEDKE